MREKNIDMGTIVLKADFKIELHYSRLGLKIVIERVHFYCAPSRRSNSHLATLKGLNQINISRRKLQLEATVSSAIKTIIKLLR